MSLRHFRQLRPPGYDPGTVRLEGGLSLSANDFSGKTLHLCEIRRASRGATPPRFHLGLSGTNFPSPSPFRGVSCEGVGA
jgi:hypothetical protein